MYISTQIKKKAYVLLRYLTKFLSFIICSTCVRYCFGYTRTNKIPWDLCFLLKEFWELSLYMGEYGRVCLCFCMSITSPDTLCIVSTRLPLSFCFCVCCCVMVCCEGSPMQMRNTGVFGVVLSFGGLRSRETGTTPESLK